MSVCASGVVRTITLCVIGEKGVAHTLLTNKDVHFAGDLVRNMVRQPFENAMHCISFVFACLMTHPSLLLFSIKSVSLSAVLLVSIRLFTHQSDGSTCSCRYAYGQALPFYDINCNCCTLRLTVPSVYRNKLIKLFPALY